MLRQMSEEMRVNLKDRLRDVRQGVRQFRHDGRPSPQNAQGRPPFPIGEIEGLLGHAVSAFDDAMSAAESLVPRRGRQPDRTVAQSLSVYFPADGTLAQAGERAFRRDLYYLAQAILAKRTIGAAVVHEANLAAVHAAMRRRHADRIAVLNATDSAGRTEAAASFCAALLITLIDHHPIRLANRAPYMFAHGNALDQTARIRVLATVTLLCGVATLDGSNAGGSDLLELADLAVDARLDRFEQACAKADADGELTPVFALLLSHLA